MAQNDLSLEWESGAAPDEMQQRLERLLAEGNDELQGAAERIGRRTEREAKRRAPVDTGNLMASIASEVTSRRDSITIEVGTNVEYAPYQEFLYGNPFLRPAIENNMRNSEAAIIAAIERATDDASE